VVNYQRHLTTFNMDYIEKYKTARRNKFTSDEDKKIQKEFPELARQDIQWARDNNLIKEMTFEEYMEAEAKQRYTEITPEMRKVIEFEEPKIPSWILGQYYDIPPTTINNLRAKASAKRKMEEEGACG
jgi:hypothetical protein